MRDAYKILFITSEWARPLAKPARNWEDNIKMGLMEYESVEWIKLAQDTEQW
jgi:hypothetical protein